VNGKDPANLSYLPIKGCMISCVDTLCLPDWALYTRHWGESDDGNDVL